MNDAQILSEWAAAADDSRGPTPEQYRALLRLERGLFAAQDADVMRHIVPLELHSTQRAERANQLFTASITDETPNERAYREGTTSRAEQARLRYERGGR